MSKKDNAISDYWPTLVFFILACLGIFASCNTEQLGSIRTRSLVFGILMFFLGVVSWIIMFAFRFFDRKKKVQDDIVGLEEDAGQLRKKSDKRNSV